jgi:GTP-binding protein HflX
MLETKALSKIVERAMLVSAYSEKDQRAHAESLLEELEELVDTLGVPILERQLIFIREIQPRYLIGKGKAEEFAAKVKELGLDVVIFDNELSPSQQRNWEELTGVAVIDRTEVILDIFARRAQSREARMQIELARWSHALPRLSGAWGHLVRQGGGIGGRGEGETQLEQDKRRIRAHMDRLKKELLEIKASRATRRKDRQRTPVPNAAIVGYTNSGKSSLLRRLTGAEVLVEDKLFATLDTTTRKVALPNKQPLLLTDTVGFVRKLPHKLVESFHATLEEAARSEFLIHLLDASQPEVIEFYNTTMKVLAELDADQRPMIMAFNKIDRVEDPAVLANLGRHFPQAHFISVHTGVGIDELLEHMGELVSGQAGIRELRLPQTASGQIARLHRETRVLETEYLEHEVRIVALMTPKLMERYGEFVVDDVKTETRKTYSPPAPL